jgi:ribosomal-protein-alanine N-acetyltransferase
MTPILRPAEPEDVPAMAALHAEAFPPAEAWGVDAIGMMLALSGAFGLLAPGQGFILARLVAGEAEVLTLAVAPAARRRGLGAALVGAIVAALAATGGKILFLEVSRENVPGRALYAGLGFAEIGLRAKYYADGTDALVLSRPISEEEAG